MLDLIFKFLYIYSCSEFILEGLQKKKQHLYCVICLYIWNIFTCKRGEPWCLFPVLFPSELGKRGRSDVQSRFGWRELQDSCPTFPDLFIWGILKRHGHCRTVFSQSIPPQTTSPRGLEIKLGNLIFMPCKTVIWSFTESDL